MKNLKAKDANARTKERLNEVTSQFHTELKKNDWHPELFSRRAEAESARLCDEKGTDYLHLIFWNLVTFLPPNASGQGYGNGPVSVCSLALSRLNHY